MGKKDICRMINKVGRSLNRNSPKIFTILGIGSGITAAVMAVKATPDYQIDMGEHKIYASEHGISKKEDVIGKTKIFAKWYGPSIGVGVISIASVLNAQRINTKRMAGLATAYKLSEAALKEYQDKVVEKFGEKKAKDIHKSILEDRIAATCPVEADMQNEPKDPGDYLCYDYYTGKYFYSTQSKLDAAGKEINRRLGEEGDYILLDEFFDLIERNQRTAAGRFMCWPYVPHTPVHFDTSKSISNPNPELPPILILDYTDMLCLCPEVHSYDDFIRCS